MEKVGILGGTFDPIHNGHLAIAEKARRHLGLARVIFIPALVPPHKRHKVVSSPDHRLQMVRLALENKACFELSDIEINREQVSYSVDTVDQLKLESPDTEYYFIIGMDSLNEIHSWHKPELLVRMCEFVVIARPGYDTDSITRGDLGLSRADKDKLLAHVIVADPVDVSATRIRAKVRAGEPIKSLVPESVNQYILKHNLYKT